MAFGALGVYPPYYSLTQELTFRHQGKVTGTLSLLTWTVSATMQPLVGRWLDRTGNYSLVVALAGLCPLVGFAVLMLLWRRPTA
jgi:ACS family hexuronate transporter-like MFS transporter